MEPSLFSASSLSNPPALKYEVFLSFRGDDTRHNFTSHLYRALCDKKIQTFIDYELRRGDEISPSLIKAIEDSHIYIIIFSQGYASSRWCLDELVKILECKKMYGRIVMPIFYEVDPAHVRFQIGSFADAFAKHEQRYKDCLDKVQRWKDALKEAANLSGSDSRVIKPESLLIEAIVDDVLKRLNDLSSSDDTSDLVGIDSRIQEIESLLCIETNDVHSVGIWGIGGIGKTTLVGAVYNKISSKFEGSHFIENVREESEQSGGLNRLRRELLSALLGDAHGNVDRGSSFAASNFAKKRLGRKKLLIVFDDVTSFRQIESLIRGFDRLGFGSRIIITTRDKQVLKNCRVDQIYKVDELSDDDALKLFCLCAFGQKCSKEDYKEMTNRVVEYVGGVPLALKVLGSSLFDKRKEVWESAINKLEVNLDKDIHNILRISFDGLDDNEQNIFLDIACFLKGECIDFVKDFLDVCDFFAEVGISALVDKSLITITKNTVTMHDLLQAMGREIVRQESRTDPGKRSRLWHHKDIYNVLMDNTGTESIEAISLDMSKIGDIHLNSRAFMKMPKLRFLKFDSSLHGKNRVHVVDGLESISTKLRYLHWHGSPLKSLSSIFQSENLVTLDMRHSQVEQLWNGSQQLVNLKEINLAWSKHLTNCPDLSGAKNLVSLNLSFTSLCEISSSVQHLSKLNDLYLSNCKRLRGLPDCTDLKSLRKLNISSCSNLKMLPELPCNIELLYLIGSAIEELPSSIKYLSKLVKLDLTSSKTLKSFPNNISEMKSLKHLRLSRCSKLDKLPDEIGTLDSLRYFEAQGTPIKAVPSSIINLNNLQKLSFEGCKGQDMLGLLLPPLSGLHSLRELDLTDCAITKLPDSLGSLSSLNELYLSGNNFESIPASIKNLSNLQYLDIGYCEALQSLPELPLISTNAYNCISLEVISCLSVPDSFVAIPSPSIKFDLINCFKLDRNVLIEEGLLKIQSLATLWKGHDYNEDLLLTPHSAVICFPGSEVPKGFSFQSLGSFITVKLPPGWLNDNFVGFGLCSVVAFRDHEDNGAFLDINFECKLKSEDGQWDVSYGTFGQFNTSRSRRKCYKIGSDHVYMGFDSATIYLDDIDELCYDEAFFQFYLGGPLGKPIECCKVNKCGVRLMYAQDIGKPSGGFNSDDEDEFWDSMEKNISSDDEDEFWESMEEPN